MKKIREKAIQEIKEIIEKLKDVFFLSDGAYEQTVKAFMTINERKKEKENPYS
ncbi:MAG: hypothetical protein ACFFD2_29005 [Promethearchaeota archaeon]